MDGDALQFEMAVDVGEGSVDGSEVDGVVDEKGEATTRSLTRSVATDKSIVWKGWVIRTSSQLCFL